ncbi:GyrI-like domain-containing protein [Methanogenium sp. S4BF]|uniref:MerR family transcriptional regulator n=1 Tax=Methanogenium sp. S4BF TaxID=1789226 RepID=UPI0024163C7F|nr:GyrI-like domain-containing protein [Methanogenium sp. S4BF]WFN33830.1 GyrI-like domain-containing protein [Methanogenium sp. S4BF]
MTAEKIPIGAFSDVTRLSKKALYCYEKKGLLVPVERDICSGYRYYSPGQIERGIWIGSLCSLGFTLDETARILSEEDRNSPVVQTLLKNRLRETRVEMQRLSMVERVLAADDPFEELFKMELNNWTKKDIPPIRAMTIRGEGPYEALLTELIGRICREMASPENARNSVRAVGPIGSVYVGEDCDETGGLVEVILPVAGKLTIADPDVEVKTLPAVTVISVICKGPYRNLGLAHTRMYAYLEENKFTCTGSPRELYLNDPSETPEEELLTEIQYPVG